MQSIRLMLISLIAFSFVNGGCGRRQTRPAEALETAISEGIRLLEAKEYKVFLASFVSPADLKTNTKEMSLEEFAKWFGVRKAPRLLEVLKEINYAKPTLDDTGTRATFALKEEIGGVKSITFVKVEKYWYLMAHPDESATQQR